MGGGLERVHQSPVIRMSERLEAQMLPGHALQRACQKARQTLLVGYGLVRFVPDEVARHRAVDQSLVVVRRFDGAEVDLRYCETARPSHVAQTVKKV